MGYNSIKSNKQKPFKLKLMETIITFLVGSFVGITVWEMGRKVKKDYKESKNKSRFYDPHETIYH